MPKFNGTGPAGKGPLTGHGSGYCAMPISLPGQELELLKNQEKALKKQLRHITTRIKRIENKSGQKEAVR
jgi:hypothetical protein